MRFLLALLVFSFSAFAGDKENLSKIQREGHAYYRTDLKVANAIYYGDGQYTVDKPFHVLPKNSVASCSHDVAIKVKMIREKLPHLNPEVVVYRRNIMGRTFYHTLVVVAKPEGGYWVLDNKNWRLKETVHHRDFPRQTLSVRIC